MPITKENVVLHLLFIKKADSTIVYLSDINILLIKDTFNKDILKEN